MSGRDKVINGVVSHWAPLIARYLSAYCQGHDCDIDDIRSDLWVLCIERSWAHDPDKASLRTYLGRCCHGRLLHMLRDAKRTRGRFVYFDDLCGHKNTSNDGGDDSYRSVDDFAAPSDGQSYLIAASALMASVAKQCKTDREVAAALLREPDATDVEIAAQIGRTPQVVFHSLRRIRAVAARELSVA